MFLSGSKIVVADLAGRECLIVVAEKCRDAVAEGFGALFPAPLSR